MESERPDSERDKPVRSNRTRIIVGLQLTLLTIFSLVSKVVNQYDFFIYPDSYYYLLIAQNILDHLHPAGTLGTGGMPFPPPGYASMKITYPVLVAVLLRFGFEPGQAGHWVAAAAAVASVPAAYLAVRRLLDSNSAGMLGALLTATSFGITYWSGFVMSDSVSVLLAFCFIALIAKVRPDRWANAADLLTGAVLAFLLMSRPTYIVAVPLLGWLAYRRWGWTRSRAMSAVAACAFLASTLAVLWFPPASFSGRILLNLLPVLALALLASLAALRLVRWARTSPAVWDHPLRKPLIVGVLMSLGAVFSALWVVERVIEHLTAASPYIGYARFALRDPAIIIGTIPGAWYLLRNRRIDVCAALLTSSVILLGTYFWAEPRESRYIIHILPFLVPVVAAIALRRPFDWSVASAKTRRATLLRRGAVLLSAVTICAVFYQGYLSITRPDYSFLETSYPAEVARGLDGWIPQDATLVTALPWPYHYHLGKPTWGAGVAYVDDVGKFIPDEEVVFVLEDASLRFHDGLLAERLTESYEPAIEFFVPIRYQYGYSGVADPGPVRGFVLKAGDLQRIMADKPDAKIAE